MRNTSKFNVRQFRKLLFCRAENTLPSTTFPHVPKPEAPKFSSTTSFPWKTSKPTNAFTSSTTLLHFSTSKKAKSISSDSEEEFFRSMRDLKSDSEVEDNDKPVESWEEEDEAEPELGDGGDGGGVALQNCSWGERALSLANEALRQFDDDDDLKLFAFKTSPKGYVYVRIDKLSTKYGCPEIELLEDFNRRYKKMLDEAGQSGELPDDLGLGVSSPGAARLLKVPDDLQRFKHMPMTVDYTDDSEKKGQMKTTVFYLEAIDMETESCTWKLADVKQNRDPAVKGKPLNRKQRDFRLQLPFTNCKKVVLYVA